MSVGGERGAREEKREEGREREGREGGWGGERKNGIENLLAIAKCRNFLL